MSWIDRINDVILAKIRRPPARIRVSPEGLTLEDGTTLRVTELDRAVAFKTDDFVGETLCLVMDFGGGRTVEVSDQHPDWDEITAHLDQHPRRRMRSEEWKLQLHRSDRDDWTVELIG